MSSITTLDVKNICRVCLTYSVNMKFLFESEQSPTIAEMLSDLTIYKILQFEDLPHLICSDCLDLVSRAYKLKQKCETSHRTLMNFLGNQQKDISSNIICGVFIKDTHEKSTQTGNSFMHPCESCGENFFTPFALKLHRQSKHYNNLLICHLCSRSFDQADNLRNHISVFHPESDYKYNNQCRVCQLQFPTRVHLKNHIQNIHQFSEVDAKSVKNHEESNNSIKTSENFDGEMELFDVENLAHLKDEEDQIPLSMLIETSNTTEVIEVSEVFSNILQENSENVIKMPNYVESQEDNLLATERSQDSASKTLSDEDSISNFSKTPDDIIHQTKRLQGIPSKDHLNCKSCYKYCENELILQQHITENHSKVSKFSRKICKNNFTDKNDLGKHLSSKHLASKKLSNSNNNHKKAKNIEKLFHCAKCDKSFSSKHTLQRHTEGHDKKRFNCKECLQDFVSKEKLNNHAKVEGHDKPLLCPECGLRCKSSNILTIHLRRHNGEKPFKCKFCSKGFPRIDDLKIHEKYHTGEKSHFCETCGKGFFRKYNLRIHMRVHTGEKPYKCPHCPQAFAQSNDLKAHIRRHTGERFRCEICNAAFLQGYQIRQHKLQEHGIHEIPPTQRVQKFTSPEEQEEQIKQNLQTDVTN